MSQNTPTTFRPLGMDAVLHLLRPAATPQTPAPQPVASVPQDTYQRQPGVLASARFAGNPGLQLIATGRAVMGPLTDATAVRQVQQALMDMAFVMPMGASGLYEAGTRQAIKNFQAMAGLVPDGKLGRQTLVALDRFAPPVGKTSWDPGSNPGPVPSPALGNGKQARVVVSLSQHRAFSFDRSGQLQKIYGVRTGREQVDDAGRVGHATAPGVKQITDMNDNPTDVSNELWPASGGRAFGNRLLDLTSYDVNTGRTLPDSPSNGQELHGTDLDLSIGRDFSHGCVGLRNADIQEIFAQVRRGDFVRFDS